MKVRTLRAVDVGMPGQREKDTADFKFLLGHFLLEKPVVYDGLKGNAALRQIETFAWRPDHSYFVLGDEPKIPCEVLSRSALHFFLSKKFGSNLKGRPLFLLLSESIAALSKFYFDLEVLRQFGSSATELEKLRGFELFVGDTVSRQKPVRYIIKLMESHSERSSFLKYKEAVFERFEAYQLLLKLARKGESRGPIAVSSAHRYVKNLKYAPLTYSYKLGNEVLYAIIHGQKETIKDKADVKKCTEILTESKSFIEFLKNLGLDEVPKARLAR